MGEGAEGAKKPRPERGNWTGLSHRRKVPNWLDLIRPFTTEILFAPGLSSRPCYRGGPEPAPSLSGPALIFRRKFHRVSGLSS